ncbi:MAG: flavodoxin [Planctomycetaceae bacterium]|nr:flavodoxin [Planctomycetaceae bacterium]
MPNVPADPHPQHARTAPASIGIFYGSTTGTTQLAATKIREQLGTLVTQLENVRKADPADLATHDLLLLGISTWNIGDMQDDWFDFLPRTEHLDLTGTTVALFAMGDAYGYPYTFLDAMGKLWTGIRNLGAPKLVGTWPITGYDFDESLAMHDDDHFVGLGLDHDNHPELTDERITMWVDKIRQETSLSQTTSHTRNLAS